MATLKSIRKRITSVKNTQKITKAMKMVAAAKLRRAQQAVEGARPFADGLKNIIIDIASKDEDNQHPLFQAKENPKKALYLIFTSNRGLCGGFNSNLLRRIETHFIDTSSSYEQVDLEVIGKKGRDYYKSRKRELKEVYLDYAEEFPFEKASEVATQMIDGFQKEEYDEYYIVFNEFKSALSQEVQIEKVLPLSFGKKADYQSSSESHIDPNQAKVLVDFIYEPRKAEVLEAALPRFIATRVYGAHLESVASELGARMTAMESASNNAKDMIGKLTLEYNRARQAAITTELMDIVNGAEAIK